MILLQKSMIFLGFFSQLLTNSVTFVFATSGNFEFTGYKNKQQLKKK